MLVRPHSLKCLSILLAIGLQGVQCEGVVEYQDTIIDGKTYYIAEPFGDYVKEDFGIVFLTNVEGIWHNSRILSDYQHSTGLHS